MGDKGEEQERDVIKIHNILILKCQRIHCKLIFKSKWEQFHLSRDNEIVTVLICFKQPSNKIFLNSLY